ncbi:putative ABC transporter ATP-binding protein [Micromonospora saelicesensis]|uniref:ABC transporter ATP-binding protein n=2 Tax=Micromonospora saelicesensis TaxID=285676 RepID=A0A1C4Z0D6_9ACTN|nr:putative ABC transporter ATP-binding protein [Micromonospora saelicesensis]RAO42544.1 putative ABC transporter ATP-binding protein [Micromonospora saelicesensis]RAO49910.1 putative ABC transporter ATP-binding protein [Micromonospora saelicesensis]RAO57005.1 putative ABC transporter ATP-binding protein [Micromonospora saelicesensis]SCF26420.1 ATP-binding cassette, subfamily C [Micromonospora saelicesensis]
MSRLPVADRRTVRRALRDMISRHRRAVGVVLALHSAAAVTGLAPPWLLGTIVDRVTAGAGVATVDRLALAIAGCVLVSALLSRYAQYAGHRFGERAVAELREEFVSRTLGLPVSVVERAGSGDLATRSSVDVSTVGTTVRDVVPTIVIATVQLTLLFGAVFLLHPLLGLAALAGLPSIVAVTRWYLRRASSAYLTEGAAAAELTETLTTTAEGARTVEALRLAEDRIKHGTTRVTTVWRARRATLALRTVFFSVVEASYPLPVAMVLLVGGYLFSRDMVSLGAVVAAALYLQQAIDPMDRLLQWTEQAQRGFASYARLLGVGMVPPEPPGTTASSRGERLVVRGARFSYSDGPDVLHGIDLEVQPGERLAVVGPSGAGKSTLARLLAGIDAPRHGVVSIGGCPVTDLDPAERRRRIALVTQEHHVFIGSVRDNLSFAAPDASDEQMRAALLTVGAEWFAELPDDLDTQLGDGARQLGAAEAQQLALARLVLADPHTLILDEATAALDPSTARRTERALAAVLVGRTVIAIAHRLNTAHDADRVAVLADGRITEIGSHDELVAAGGAYAALWHSWHTRVDER